MSCADDLDDARSDLAKLDAELTALTEEAITLRAENERLRDALLRIKIGTTTECDDGVIVDVPMDADEMIEIAAAALTPPEDSPNA